MNDLGLAFTKVGHAPVGFDPDPVEIVVLSIRRHA